MKHCKIWQRKKKNEFKDALSKANSPENWYITDKEWSEIIEKATKTKEK